MAIELKKEHIDELLLEDIESDNHPSEFELGKDYAVLILRLPEMSNNGLQVISYAFVRLRSLFLVVLCMTYMNSLIKRPIRCLKIFKDITMR